VPTPTPRIVAALRANRLWDDFHWAISKNRADDPAKTVSKFRQLPRRQPGHTAVAA
jgi:hypothetical protein